MLRDVLDAADCAVLRRTPKSHDGVAQPLACLLKRPSATEGYSFDLSGGFEAALRRTDGLKLRKNALLGPVPLNQHLRDQFAPWHASGACASDFEMDGFML